MLGRGGRGEARASRPATPAAQWHAQELISHSRLPTALSRTASRLASPRRPRSSMTFRPPTPRKGTAVCIIGAGAGCQEPRAPGLAMLSPNHGTLLPGRGETVLDLSTAGPKSREYFHLAGLVSASPRPSLPWLPERPVDRGLPRNLEEPAHPESATIDTKRQPALKIAWLRAADASNRQPKAQPSQRPEPILLIAPHSPAPDSLWHVARHRPRDSPVRSHQGRAAPADPAASMQLCLALKIHEK